MWDHPTKDGATEKSSGHSAPQTAQRRTCGVGRAQDWRLELRPEGCTEEKWKSEHRTALRPGKAFPLLSRCSSRQNEDPAGASCRKEMGMETSKKDMKSFGRHKGERNLPELKLLAAPSQPGGPTAPQGAIKLKLSWIASPCFVSKVQMCPCSQAPTERLERGMP